MNKITIEYVGGKFDGEEALVDVESAQLDQFHPRAMDEPPNPTRIEIYKATRIILQYQGRGDATIPPLEPPQDGELKIY